jgi:hypothetical protein
VEVIYLYRQHYSLCLRLPQEVILLLLLFHRQNRQTHHYLQLNRQILRIHHYHRLQLGVILPLLLVLITVMFRDVL